MDFERNRKTMLVEITDNIFIWVIFTKFLKKNQCRVGAVMARTNIKNIYHDFDLTKQKFIVKYKNGTRELSESRQLLWDTTLTNGDHFLHMKRFVLVPYYTTSCVSMSILSTLQQMEETC